MIVEIGLVCAPWVLAPFLLLLCGGKKQQQPDEAFDQEQPGQEDYPGAESPYEEEPEPPIPTEVVNYETQTGYPTTNVSARPDNVPNLAMQTEYGRTNKATTRGGARTMAQTARGDGTTIMPASLYLPGQGGKTRRATTQKGGQSMARPTGRGASLYTQGAPGTEAPQTKPRGGTSRAPTNRPTTAAATSHYTDKPTTGRPVATGVVAPRQPTERPATQRPAPVVKPAAPATQKQAAYNDPAYGTLNDIQEMQEIQK